MTEFEDARAALARVVKRVFPQAKAEPWRGHDGWVVPLAEGPLVIALADRKAGPVVYFLDPGDHDALLAHESLLAETGASTGRGCIYPKKGAPFPSAALETLFRDAKVRGGNGAKRRP